MEKYVIIAVKVASGTAIMGAVFYMTTIKLIDPQVFVNMGTAVLVGLGIIAGNRKEN